MFRNTKVSNAVRTAIVFGAVASVSSFASFAQEEEKKVERIAVTGSRIMKADLVSNSPIVSVDEKELTSRADVTLDTFLNTLPQVNPSASTTSNNPGNSGQSNINLRGLGSNRNLVLMDGRRLMPSSPDMTVDLNTIPAALVESIEVVSGGAGAAYGADAVSGAVNMKMKRNFEGLDFRFSNSNQLSDRDAKENNFSLVFGGNFDDDKGNAVFAYDHSTRQALTKGQRGFAATASSTTSYIPEGLLLNNGGNLPSQAAIDSVFAKYGVGAGKVVNSQDLISFNADGSLFSRGVAGTPLDVQNWKYGDNDVAINTNLFPDFYSYNFDQVNLLVLPLERKSFMNKLDYQLTEKVKVFGSVAWTNYSATTALAPTPFPTIQTQGPGGTNASMISSNLIAPGKVSALRALFVPVTNPFIPADLKTLLNSREGDNPDIMGAGANEAFALQSRSVWGGLRNAVNDNTVLQYSLGFSGEINDEWRWEAYAMEGKTNIEVTQEGAIDSQKMQRLIEAPDGGNSLCAGGYNPFGRAEVSDACKTYLLVENVERRELNQRVMQGFVSGDMFELPSGMLSTVFGIETRKFDYDRNPGALTGAISGPNVATAAGGENEFTDFFAEAYIPLLDSKPMADLLDLTLGFRTSESQFYDTIKKVESKKDRNNALKAEVSWEIADGLPRLRASYQRAVRAPNFDELFSGGNSAPQFYDPCSANSEFRKASGEAGRKLCQDTGVTDTARFTQAPGSQLTTTIGGNTALKPETADTITFGAVHNFDSGITAALDYYNIDIQDAILTPNSNPIIADCYNYYGNNPNLSKDQISCKAIIRGGSGSISGVKNLDQADGKFTANNAGFIKTSGIDLQAGYRLDSGLLGGLTWNTDVYINYLLSYETQSRDGMPVVDYTGSISYFGAGFGQSFPELKANWNNRVTLGDFEVALRGRFIDGMTNRLKVEFPIETYPTGVASVVYWDTSLTYNLFEGANVRLGINNLFDKQPPTYVPNVQSGTDPSLYDVVGRRYTAAIQVKF